MSIWDNLRKYFKAEYCDIVNFGRFNFLITCNLVKSVNHINNRQIFSVIEFLIERKTCLVVETAYKGLCPIGI